MVSNLEYKTVIEKSPEDFDETCGILSEDGWKPLFSPAYAKDSDGNITKYIQQWTRPFNYQAVQ